MIALTDVTKTYGKGAEPSVRALSFVVAQGEFLVLIGPSDDQFTEILRKKGRADGGEDWVLPDGGEQLASSDGTGGPSSGSASK